MDDGQTDGSGGRSRSIDVADLKRELLRQLLDVIAMDAPEDSARVRHFVDDEIRGALDQALSDADIAGKLEHMGASLEESGVLLRGLRDEAIGQSYLDGLNERVGDLSNRSDRRFDQVSDQLRALTSAVNDLIAFQAGQKSAIPSAPPVPEDGRPRRADFEGRHIPSIRKSWFRMPDLSSVPKWVAYGLPIAIVVIVWLVVVFGPMLQRLASTSFSPETPGTHSPATRDSVAKTQRAGRSDPEKSNSVAAAPPAKGAGVGGITGGNGGTAPADPPPVVTGEPPGNSGAAGAGAAHSVPGAPPVRQVQRPADCEPIFVDISDDCRIQLKLAFTRLAKLTIGEFISNGTQKSTRLCREFTLNTYEKDPVDFDECADMAVDYYLNFRPKLLFFDIQMSLHLLSEASGIEKECTPRNFGIGGVDGQLGQGSLKAVRMAIPCLYAITRCKQQSATVDIDQRCDVLEEVLTAISEKVKGNGVMKLSGAPSDSLNEKMAILADELALVVAYAYREDPRLQP